MALRNVILLLLLPFIGRGQFVDAFDDGDFTFAPIWSGDSSDFMVNSTGWLRLDADPITNESYLSTRSRAIDTATWTFRVCMDFNPSSSNQAKVFLCSDSPDLEAELNGYFILLGGSRDEISLFRQTGLSAEKLIEGPEDMLDLNVVDCRVMVSRSSLGEWVLLVDVTGAQNYSEIGSAIDTSILRSTHFG